MNSNIILGKGTKILLYDGSSKKIEDINTNDLLISPSGEIVKIKNINNVKSKLIKIKIASGRLIVCGEKTEFLSFEKFNCRKSSLKKSINLNMVYRPLNKGLYIIDTKIEQSNCFNISKQLAWLLGLFASNGRVSFKRNRVSGITIFSKFKDEIYDIIIKIFPGASVRKVKKLITITGKSVVDFFITHITGFSRKEKKLSADIMWMNKDLQLEFLRAWFSNKGVHGPRNFIIGSTCSSNMAEAIGFMLMRFAIPFSISENKDNYRFVINCYYGKDLFHEFLIKNTDFSDEMNWRNFNNNVIYKVEDIERFEDDCFEIEVNNGLIANGYKIKTNLIGDFVNVNSVCECGEITKFSNICYKCQLRNLDTISWRYGIRCLNCNKFIENATGAQKFCSDVCRRIFYNPLEFKNNGADYNGYVNKGFLSFPQKTILENLQNEFNCYVWTYNDRTILRNPKTNYPIELDIWCDKLRLAIEFDGARHFEDIDIEKLNYTQKMDEIKNIECLENNIKLLRINYKDDWKNKEWIMKKVGELLNGNN